MPAAAPGPHGRAGRRLRTSRQAARHLLPGGKRLSPLANTSGQCVRSPGRPPRKRPPPPQGCAAPARRQLHTQRPAAAAVAFNAPPRLAPAVTARSFPKPRVHPPPGRGEGRGEEGAPGEGGRQQPRPEARAARLGFPPGSAHLQLRSEQGEGRESGDQGRACPRDRPRGQSLTGQGRDGTGRDGQGRQAQGRESLRSPTQPRQPLTSALALALAKAHLKPSLGQAPAPHYRPALAPPGEGSLRWLCPDTARLQLQGGLRPHTARHRSGEAQATLLLVPPWLPRPAREEPVHSNKTGT